MNRSTWGGFCIMSGIAQIHTDAQAEILTLIVEGCCIPIRSNKTAHHIGYWTPCVPKWLIYG